MWLHVSVTPPFLITLVGETGELLRSPWSMPEACSVQCVENNKRDPASKESKEAALKWCPVTPQTCWTYMQTHRILIIKITNLSIVITQLISKPL